jgi:hypothetical protein
VKKIYSSRNLSWLLISNGFDVVIFDDIDEIPKNCNFVAITFFNNYTFKPTLEKLLKKAKFILVDLNEPTSLQLLNDAEDFLNRYDNIEIVSMIKTNYSSRIKFSGNWFISPTNFYSAKSPSTWATDFLSKITNDDFNKKLKFDCLLGQERFMRNLIEKKYKESLHREQILFSYFKENIKNGIWDFSVNDINFSGEIITHNWSQFSPSSAIPYSLYNRTYYSIVSETLDFNNYSFFTEKIAKPILAKRPFVVFSGRHYLKNLKQLGFKTFDNIIDESYDDIVDLEQRTQHAWEQVEYLISQDPLTVYRLTKDIREHNYQLFKHTDWNQETLQIINQFISKR